MELRTNFGQKVVNYLIINFSTHAPSYSRTQVIPASSLAAGPTKSQAALLSGK